MGIISICCMIFRFSVVILPVSYTHLDVYKRQRRTLWKTKDVLNENKVLINNENDGPLQGRL